MLGYFVMNSVLIFLDKYFSIKIVMIFLIKIVKMIMISLVRQSTNTF